MPHFKGSVYDLVKFADDQLERGKIDTALLQVFNFVEGIITEPLCTAQVFASRDLDQLCMRIGNYSLANLSKPIGDQRTVDTTQNTIIYLVSRLQRTGGHSRLILDFIRAQPERKHLVISTEVVGPSDKLFTAQLYAIDKNAKVVKAPASSFATRLHWLQTELLACQPEHIYLFNHHQDSVAVAALPPELGLPGSFCHHGDHHLCLGVHLQHLSHIDLHPMGYHHCRNELGVKNHYLPLTFKDNLCPPAETPFMKGGKLTTATAARFNKIEVPYYINYLTIIPRLLKATGGRHIHIGRLSPWALMRLRSQMRKHGIDSEKFVYIDWTASVWKSLQEHNVDVYIASFPYGAGLTLVEAMGAGIPVVMHEHMYSRVLSGLELSYSRAFRWSDPEVLLTHMSALTPKALEVEKQLSRAQYEKFHRPEILEEYFQDSEFAQIPIPALDKNFRPRLDEWATWTERQLTFSRLFTRFIYRILRRLRANYRRLLRLAH